jgi:SAM-dependent methyltransferase
MSAAPHVFDRALYLQRQRRASSETIVLLDARIGEELQERVSLINRTFERALVIAPRSDGFRNELLRTGRFVHIETREPAEEDDLGLAAHSWNAVISLLDLHATDDVPGYIAQVSRALLPDGLAMFAFFAGETLRELREVWLGAEQDLTGGASPRVAPMIDLRETGGLLQRAGLALPVADLDRVTLRYADGMSLMREIKAAGLGNCLVGRSRSFTPMGLLFKAATGYPADADGRLSATIEIAWATAWKPHASQQQPLRPGSAKARLADALKVAEGKL